MDDARPLHAGDAAEHEAAAAPSSALTSVPSPWPGAGWTTSPDGLSTIRRSCVLVDDVDRDLGLGDGLGRRRRRHDELERRARLDERVRLERASVEGQVAVRDELLDVAAGQAGEVGRPPVGAAAPRLGRDQRSGARSPRRQASTPARRATDGHRLAARSSRIAKLIAGVRDVERVPAQAADAGIDEVDDVAEPQPVDEVADRAAEQQPEGDRACSAAAGAGRGTTTISPTTHERHEPEEQRLVAKQAEQRRRVFCEWTRRTQSPTTATDSPGARNDDEPRLGELVHDDDGRREAEERRPSGGAPGARPIGVPAPSVRCESRSRGRAARRCRAADRDRPVRQRDRARRRAGVGGRARRE